MSTDLGGPGTRSARPAPGAPPAVPEPPRALRARPPGWRDPRMWVGVAIVAASVVAGSRLLAAADDTVAVWTAAGDLAPGERLGEDDLAAERVRFADDEELERYFTTDDELPADLVLTRAVGAGELVPRAALGAPDDGEGVELPVAVDPALVPPGVTDGSVVDVYVAASTPRAGKPVRDVEPALAGVRVVAAPPLDQAFGSTGRRQLVLAVSDEEARAFFAVMASTESPVVTVLRQG